MEKLFTVAGTSNLNGTVKFRFANDMSRVKVLEYHGHTEVQLIQLPTAMTKADAIAYLESQGSDEPAVEDAAEPAAQGPALDVTEEAIQEMIATMPKRNERGHFINKDLLREAALRELAAA